MLDNTHSHGVVARRATIGIAVGFAVWLGLLLHGASLSRQNAAGRDVRFGPLILHTISVERDASDARAAITIESGLAWYTVFWTIAGISTGLIRPHTKHTRD